MFKFNFNSGDRNESPDSEEGAAAIVPSRYDECHEVFPTGEQLGNDYKPSDVFLNVMTFENDQKILHVPVDEIIEQLTAQSEDINLAEQSHSDVVPGVYEGGAKVWECTQDLGDLLTRKNSDGERLIDIFRDKLVLDLGCGAGILGILALKNGATVHFQDYNETVLQNITIPNVIANVGGTAVLEERCRFFSGDWLNYAKNPLEQEKFDYILTSETIYNIGSYHKIIKVLKNRLRPDGICYLAAKLHYFGVGGSLRHFEKVLHQDNAFTIETVLTRNQNVTREVIKIAFKQTAL